MLHYQVVYYRRVMYARHYISVHLSGKASVVTLWETSTINLNKHSIFSMSVFLNTGILPTPVCVQMYTT